jgi:hypothetical protein
MKKIIIACLTLFILFSCGSESQNKNLKYQNIVILSDMSSRLDNRQQKDINEIHKIVQFFKNECVKPGEKIGDKSSISFAAFSENIAASIDIDIIKNLGEKQRFINSTGDYKNKGLNQQIENFENTVEEKYGKTRNNGLDLISLLIEKIVNEPIVKEDKFLTNGIDSTFIKYDNHIYIFTDGYLEYLNKNANNQFYFGNSEIEKVRNYCKTKNIDVKKALEENKVLGLHPYLNEKNKYINLHILETHERDKNLNTQTYKNPIGLRDNEILEAVWRKWSNDSGFKDLEWKKY